MPEFLRLSSPNEALKILLDTLGNQLPTIELIETSQSLGRVLAKDVIAPHPLPDFQRSTVDGYAVRARDTFGVSDSLPGYLTLCGEVPMGDAPKFVIKSGTCAVIHTGGMLPEGADSVVMVENTQTVQQGPSGWKINNEIEIFRPIGEGENVLQIGEDVPEGKIVINTGKKLRPADIGGCMALGITQLRVAKKPRIGIISTGDEVISPERHPHHGQVRDVNTYTLSALVQQAGGEPRLYGIVQDNVQELTKTCHKCLIESDAVVVTAGSSASVRDITSEVISSLGKPGVLVHGVNIRPGKPTILADCDGKAVIGLPGNPVSALVIAQLFLVPIIHKLLGEIHEYRPSILAKLTINLPSQAGREDWIPVNLIPTQNDKTDFRDIQWNAEPVFGKSNLIFSLAAADGLVRIPPEATGLDAGEIVDVVLM